VNVQPREPPTDVLPTVLIATELYLTPEEDALDFDMSAVPQTSLDKILPEVPCDEHLEPTFDAAIKPDGEFRLDTDDEDKTTPIKK
jgi:hypothetical protein